MGLVRELHEVMVRKDTSVKTLFDEPLASSASSTAMGAICCWKRLPCDLLFSLRFEGVWKSMSARSRFFSTGERHRIVARRRGVCASGSAHDLAVGVSSGVDALATAGVWISAGAGATTDVSRVGVGR